MHSFYCISDFLVAECEFAVDSLGVFKNKLLIDKIKFNQNDHKVVSVDVVNMYNNVNVPRVISHILNRIYPLSNGSP